MIQLENYVFGKWVKGEGVEETLVNPTTEEALATASSKGIDRAEVIAYAREKGVPALQALTFKQRGEVLKGMSKAIHGAREELIELGMKNAGNTRGDAKFDIDGASGTLMAYASWAKGLGEQTHLLDGEPVLLGRSSRWMGRHIRVSRKGVAVHINAYNFPAWGLAEKAAVAILAGIPVIAKPATPTALMTEVMVRKIVEAGVLPEGALSLLIGDPGDLLHHLGHQDVVAFTGSSATAAKIRAIPQLLERSVHVNVEADSLNCAILGKDVEVGDETYRLFVGDVARDLTQKAGQKCTAIRRVMVPADLVDQVAEDVAEQVSGTVIGAPDADGVRMGPVATAAQRDRVLAGLGQLLDAPGVSVECGGKDRPELKGVEGEKGFFIAPTLLKADNARSARAVHELEVFGPVSTVMPYDSSAQDAVDLVALGNGGLVASVYSNKRPFIKDVVFGLAPLNGRVNVGSEKVAGVAMGPGTVFPGLLHGGPGRAGGGEELGGLRGLEHYMHRVALQGYGPWIDNMVVPKELAHQPRTEATQSQEAAPQTGPKASKPDPIFRASGFCRVKGPKLQEGDQHMWFGVCCSPATRLLWFRGPPLEQHVRTIHLCRPWKPRQPHCA